MELKFTKGAGKHDLMQVIRTTQRGPDDSASIECPKQGIVPHDMVHFAVESMLHKRGFVRRVFEGEAASFQMQADAESDSVERLVEVFQGDGWSGWGTDAAEMLDLYQVTCTARRCAALAIGVADVEAVRSRLLELTAQWQAVPVGGSLSLRFEPESATQPG